MTKVHGLGKGTCGYVGSYVTKKAFMSNSTHTISIVQFHYTLSNYSRTLLSSWSMWEITGAPPFVRVHPPHQHLFARLYWSYIQHIYKKSLSFPPLPRHASLFLNPMLPPPQILRMPPEDYRHVSMPPCDLGWWIQEVLQLLPLAPAACRWRELTQSPMSSSATREQLQMNANLLGSLRGGSNNV